MAEVPRPAGCFDGTHAPPAGTQLALDDTLTWTAYGDDRNAWNVGGPYDTRYGVRADQSNQVSTHAGWQICFA